LPDASALQRLPAPHDRGYISVFVALVLHRAAYGSREGQKIDFVPLDNRLALPSLVLPAGTGFGSGNGAERPTGEVTRGSSFVRQACHGSRR
jgi:hypothetical protein